MLRQSFDAVAPVSAFSDPFSQPAARPAQRVRHVGRETASVQEKEQEFTELEETDIVSEEERSSAQERKESAELVSEPRSAAAR